MAVSTTTVKGPDGKPSPSLVTARPGETPAKDNNGNFIPDQLEDNGPEYLLDKAGKDGAGGPDGVPDGLNYDINNDAEADYKQPEIFGGVGYPEEAFSSTADPSKSPSTATKWPNEIDKNGDGIVDALATNTAGDPNKMDYQEDSQGNGILDGVEHDLNANGKPDWAEDTNRDGRLDPQELAPSPTNTQVADTSGGSKGLNTGAKAGIAVGVVLFVLICGALGYYFFRRSKQARNRWNGGGIEKTGYEEAAPTSGEVEAEPPSVVWREPPKDDDAMLRMFKNLDGRITDHVLNFYVAGDSRTYQAELARIPRDVRKALELHVSRLDHLVASENSRIFALRALLTGMVLRTVTEGAFYTDTKGGKLTSTNPAAGDEGYQESRERTILRLAEIVHDQMRTFTTPDANDPVRLRSLEEVARAVAELAASMERQPHSWDLIWGGWDGSDYVTFDPEIMDVATHVPRDGSEGAAPKLRAVVFPGLSKSVVQGQDVETVVLAKMQVLFY